MSESHANRIEVCLRKKILFSDINAQEMKLEILEYISREKLQFNTQIELNEAAQSGHLKMVESIVLEGNDEVLLAADDLDPLDVCILYYCPYEQNAELETLDAEADDSDSTSASKHWLLPNKTFVSLWENLVYENDLKEKILSYALSALKFSQHKINHNIISCNRLILLHGPPGTGKTSLCKAIAQKLSIRLKDTYRYTHLIEINSHSLFSKWFSESGKLVMKLFSKIHEILADPQSLVCILIDEVESLAYSRDTMSSQEPKDAMRVVNALLTQLDGIKEYSNVLVLATSNLAKTIDNAFLDRVDIKQYVGFPGADMIRKIYQSMLQEMNRVGLLKDTINKEIYEENLNSLVTNSSGLSGRALRKLPFLALASHFSSNPMENITIDNFLSDLLIALAQYKQQNKLD